jgi:hypothetical protein
MHIELMTRYGAICPHFIHETEWSTSLGPYAHPMYATVLYCAVLHCTVCSLHSFNIHHATPSGSSWQTPRSVYLWRWPAAERERERENQLPTSWHTLHAHLFQSRPTSLRSVLPKIMFIRMLNIAWLGALASQYWAVMLVHQSTYCYFF